MTAIVWEQYSNTDSTATIALAHVAAEAVTAKLIALAGLHTVFIILGFVSIHEPVFPNLWQNDMLWKSCQFASHNKLRSECKDHLDHHVYKTKIELRREPYPHQS
jgi:hypothetical protein